MPDLELQVEVIGNETAVATVSVDSRINIEVELDTTVTTNQVTEIEVAEVALPDAIAFEDTVKNEGNAPGLMVLNAADPIPPGTPVGTVILRKS